MRFTKPPCSARPLREPGLTKGWQILAGTVGVPGPSSPPPPTRAAAPGPLLKSSGKFWKCWFPGVMGLLPTASLPGEVGFTVFPLSSFQSPPPPPPPRGLRWSLAPWLFPPHPSHPHFSVTPRPFLPLLAYLVVNIFKSHPECPELS